MNSLPTLTFILVVLAAFAAPIDATTIYQWLDANGNIHFTSSLPPPGAKSIETRNISTDTNILSTSPAAKNNTPPPRDEVQISRDAYVPPNDSGGLPQANGKLLPSAPTTTNGAFTGGHSSGHQLKPPPQEHLSDDKIHELPKDASSNFSWEYDASGSSQLDPQPLDATSNSSYVANNNAPSTSTSTTTKNKIAPIPIIFRSGFEPGTRVTPGLHRDDIIGTDHSVDPPNDWGNDLEGHSTIGSFSLQYQGGNRSDRLAQIIQDPTTTGNHVLHFWLHRPRTVAGPAGFKGRIQANLYDNNNLTEVYFRRRLYLHSDFDLLQSYSEEVQWLTLEEMWATAGWVQHRHPFRISLNLVKDAGRNKPLRLSVHGQRKTADGWWPGTLWRATNTLFTVPSGEWITLTTYYRKGDAAEGRYCLTAQTDDMKRQVIFDLVVPTYDPQSLTAVPLTHWNPLKLYTSDNIVDHVRTSGGTLQLYIDDIAIWQEVPSNDAEFPCP